MSPIPVAWGREHWKVWKRDWKRGEPWEVEASGKRFHSRTALASFTHISTQPG